VPRQGRTLPAPAIGLARGCNRRAQDDKCGMRHMADESIATGATVVFSTKMSADSFERASPLSQVNGRPKRWRMTSPRSRMKMMTI
jgi:hypothetical protein